MPPTLRLLKPLVTLLPLGILAVGVVVLARDDDRVFQPGNLVLSRSVYDNRAANVDVGQQLPPFCPTGSCVTAAYPGLYPFVFNNAPIDGSFGITSKIFLDQLRPDGTLINRLEVPNSLSNGIDTDDDQMVTSFSSKSELALNLSTDRQVITFMGYLAPVNALDISNSGTPLGFDPTNPVGESAFRVIAEVDAHGRFHFTLSNAYSGNNGRAAILNSAAGVYYMSGNAGNGSNPQPDAIIIEAGAQITDRSTTREVDQNPGQATPVGSFSITELGDKADKVGKDDNFRGLTISNDVIYLSKGSGGNGVDTVYFIDTTGEACPGTGVGLPVAGAKLPTTPINYIAANLQTQGVPPNMCILKGFNTVLAKTSTNSFPFGLWFANATTLYVADEGDGTNGGPGAGFYAPASASKTAGLQKWVFNGTQWTLAYVLQAGLGLGSPYVVTGYPTGVNAATSGPWAPATDGLRNLTGRQNGDGTVTIWAVTSTISGSGDQGADPNQLVRITDVLSATTPGSETFETLRTARSREVLRGVSFTPEDRGPDRDRDRGKDGGR